MYVTEKSCIGYSSFRFSLYLDPFYNDPFGSQSTNQKIWHLLMKVSTKTTQLSLKKTGSEENEQVMLHSKIKRERGVPLHVGGTPDLKYLKTIPIFSLKILALILFGDQIFPAFFFGLNGKLSQSAPLL